MATCALVFPDMLSKAKAALGTVCKSVPMPFMHHCLLHTPSQTNLLNCGCTAAAHTNSRLGKPAAWGSGSVVAPASVDREWYGLKFGPDLRLLDQSFRAFDAWPQPQIWASQRICRFSRMSSTGIGAPIGTSQRRYLIKLPAVWPVS